jgi:1-acyl-sn-glycerol-3-phosphate acyltransferase
MLGRLLDTARLAANTAGRAVDGLLIDDEIRSVIDRLDWQVNRHGYDRWGTSRQTVMRSLAVARWLHRHYFRTEVHGIDRVPEGRVLLIANHSGQLPFDGMLIGAAMALEADPPRFTHAMIEKFFARPPGVGTWMMRTGQLIGVPENARRLLEDDDAAVLVFPEGVRGSGKTWPDRYKIMGFGQGFLRLALGTETPIVPVAVIGGEESIISLSQMKPLARLLGVPYAPLTPTLLPLPLPTKIRLHVGHPLRFSGTGNEEDAVVTEMVAEVEQAVQALIDRGLEERQNVFY